MNRSLSSGKTLSVGFTALTSGCQSRTSDSDCDCIPGVIQERQGGMSVDGEQ
jgi:hypothetical protein